MELAFLLMSVLQTHSHFPPTSRGCTHAHIHTGVCEPVCSVSPAIFTMVSGTVVMRFK